MSVMGVTVNKFRTGDWALVAWGGLLILITWFAIQFFG